MHAQPQRGDRIAGYRVEERLGEGGRGRVYRATHEASGRVVALKVLREGAPVAPPLEVPGLRHPHLVEVLASGTAAHGRYVVMELLQGTTLRAAVSRAGKADATTAVAVLLPVLEALEAAHRRGMAHGDLKPENVFLARRDGGGVVVKLLDLGAALPAAQGVVVGSASYLSPEQVDGHAPDARSDVFGAGVLLFELLAGRPPFEASTALAAAYRVVHLPAPRLGHPALQPVLDVALAKDPVARFPRAAAFAAALAPFAAEATVSAAAVSALATP